MRKGILNNYNDCSTLYNLNFIKVPGGFWDFRHNNGMRKVYRHCTQRSSNYSCGLNNHKYREHLTVYNSSYCVRYSYYRNFFLVLMLVGSNFYTGYSKTNSTNSHGYGFDRYSKRNHGYFGFSSYYDTHVTHNFSHD